MLHVVLLTDTQWLTGLEEWSGARKMSDSEENAAPTTSLEDADIVDKKSHSTSVVWRYLDYLRSDKKQSDVHCKLCRRLVPSKTGNTCWYVYRSILAKIQYRIENQYLLWCCNFCPIGYRSDRTDPNPILCVLVVTVKLRKKILQSSNIIKQHKHFRAL